MRKYILALAIAFAVLLVSIPLWIVSGVALESRQPTPYPMAQPTATYRAAPGWDDIRVEPSVRTAVGSGVPAFERWYRDAGNTTNGVYCYSFTDESIAGNEKEIFFSLQMPHAWRLGSAIHMHTHWVGASTVATSTVVWGLEYTWAEPITGLFTNTTTITTTNREGGGINTTQYVHNLTEFATITPTVNSDNVSTVMLARLYRNSSIATDTYTDKACLLYIDAHFINDSPSGSIGEYSK